MSTVQSEKLIDEKISFSFGEILGAISSHFCLVDTHINCC